MTSRTLRRFTSILGGALAVVSAGFVTSKPHQSPTESWSLASVDVEVQVLPDSNLTFAGTLRLQPSAAPGPGPRLFLGAGLQFDSAIVSTGDRVELNRTRDTVTIRLSRGSRRGTELILRAWWRAPSRVGRNVAAGREGAFASWGAIWYPVPVPADSGAPNLLVPGRTTLSVPLAWRTLANGRFDDSALAGRYRRETWFTPRAVARSFIAAAYRVSRGRVGTREVGVYLLERHAHQARAYAQAIPRMVDILAARLGPYPFESFAIAEVPASLTPPGFGGRSEQGYFLAHTDALEGPGINVQLFAHELAHMWFPNLVDSRPPGDDMMDEAIANYAVALVLEATVGDSAARAELVDGHPDFSERGYFHYVRLGWDEPLMADYSPLIARAKGPLVYRMLRERIGDRIFFGVLQDFARRYAGRGASLEDLRSALVSAAPNDTSLTRFLAEWLDRPGAPVLDVSLLPRSDGRRARVRVEQLGPRYHFPLELVFEGDKNASRQTIQVADSVGVFGVTAPGPVTALRVDPEHKVLLWRPAFGPHPSAPAWTAAQWEAWLEDQTAWLMRHYWVRQVRILAIDSGRVSLERRVGGAERWDADTAMGRAEIDSVRRAQTSDSLRLAWRTSKDETRLIAVAPGGMQGCRIVVRGGWGGRQLAMHLAQEIALQRRWSSIPR